MDAFESMDDREYRGRHGEPVMPAGVKYIEIEDFVAGRARTLDEDGVGESIVMQLVVTSDTGHKMAGHFSLGNDAAMGMFTTLGMILLDLGLPLPDVQRTHDELLAWRHQLDD